MGRWWQCRRIGGEDGGGGDSLVVDGWDIFMGAREHCHFGGTENVEFWPKFPVCTENVKKLLLFRAIKGRNFCNFFCKAWKGQFSKILAPSKCNKLI